MFIQKQNGTIKLNGRELTRSNWDIYPNKKGVRLLKRFGDNGFEKEDTMLLTLEMADQDPNIDYKDQAPAVKISHVVAL